MSRTIAIDFFVLTVGKSISMREACSIYNSARSTPVFYLAEVYIEYAYQLTTNEYTSILKKNVFSL